MKNILLTLNESEKRRILEMHKNATKKQYLSEQGDNYTDYGITSITYPQPGDLKTPYFQGESLDIVFRDVNGNNIYYKCVTDPAVEKGMKFRKLKNPDTGKMENTELDPTPRGSMMDENGNKLTYEKLGNVEYIKGTLVKKGWEKFLPQWCAGVYAWYNQEKAKLDAEATQIASAEAEKQKQQANAETQKQIQAAINAGKLTKKVVNGQTRYYSTGKGPFTVGYFQHNLPAGTDLTDQLK